jgi:glycogen debranching enzyme
MQAKFSIHEDQAVFLSSYKKHGFKDKSSMMREALNLLKKELESHKLRQSADLYAEIYCEDAELKPLTDAAVQEWPE